MTLHRTRPVFLQDRTRTRWKCTLCPSHKFEGIRKARQHEDTQAHTQAIRSLDIWPSPNDTGPADPADRQTSPGPFLPLRTTLLDEMDDEDGLRIGIHGPALAGDDEDQIYDNFSGPLANNLTPYTQQEDILSDDDSVDWDQELKSDGPLDLLSDIPLFSERDQSDYDGPEPDLGAEDWWPWPKKEVSIYRSRPSYRVVHLRTV